MARSKKKSAKREEMVCVDDSFVYVLDLSCDIEYYRMIGTPEALEEADKLEVELARLKKRREKIWASNMRIYKRMELENEYRSRLLYLLNLWISEKEKTET